MQIKKEEYTRKATAAVGTAITLALVVLLLVFFGFVSKIPQTEEGILINFGNSLVGGGMDEPSQARNEAKPEETSSSQTAKQETTPKATTAPEKINTQDFEEAPSIPTQKKKETKVPVKTEEKKPQPDPEKERIEREKREAEARRQKELEEQQRKANEISKGVADAFGSNSSTTNSTAQGNDNGNSNQGGVNGSTTSTSKTGEGLGNSGNSYSLEGRSLVGPLPSPVYTVQEEAIV